MTGVVTEFDERVGLGTVEAGTGERYRFHCTQVGDGTRTIEVGTRVRFDVVAGHLGQWEATRVERA